MLKSGTLLIVLSTSLFQICLLFPDPSLRRMAFKWAKVTEATTLKCFLSEIGISECKDYNNPRDIFNPRGSFTERDICLIFWSGGLATTFMVFRHTSLASLLATGPQKGITAPTLTTSCSSSAFSVELCSSLEDPTAATSCCDRWTGAQCRGGGSHKGSRAMQGELWSPPEPVLEKHPRHTPVPASTG